MTPVERITPFSEFDSEFVHAFAWYGLQTIPAAYANCLFIIRPKHTAASLKKKHYYQLIVYFAVYVQFLI